MSKKPRKRKLLSEHEAERRRKLREQRIINRKNEKRLFWIKVLFFTILFLLFFVGMFVIDWNYGGKGLLIYLAVVLIITTTFTDRCGIRRILFQYYPEHFIFGDYLKRRYPERSFLMELSRTFCYYSLALLMLCPRLSVIWIVIYVITTIIGYAYLLFDRNDEYAFDKASKYSDTTTFLVIGCIPGCVLLERLAVKQYFAAFLVAVILTASYLLSTKSKRKVSNACLMFVLSLMNIISMIAIIKTLI